MQCTISALCNALRSEVVEEEVLSHDVEAKLRAKLSGLEHKNGLIVVPAFRRNAC